MLKMTLITYGNKMPTWIKGGVEEFSKRLQEYVHLNLIEIPLIKRGKSNDLARILDKEASLLHAAIPPGAYIIALAIEGEVLSSEKLALKLDQLQHITSHLCFLIGGPQGLHSSVLTQANERWSLSRLTLPHPLVRIILLEAIYRAWSILDNHPYHK